MAEDSFLPRWLTRRGHRLVFSNGIILLAALSLTLMVVAGATVDALIPFYAIGVFTGFAMAGFGMARYHRRVRESGWRHRLVINAAGGIYTALVVVLFAVVKFTEGAWVIVILFPVLVYGLIRLNREFAKRATRAAGLSDYERPAPPSGADPIGSLRSSGKVTVQGRLRAAEVLPSKNSTMLACEVADSTGDLTALFYGRAHIAGIEPGRRIRLCGTVGIGTDGRRAMVNPRYELLN